MADIPTPEDLKLTSSNTEVYPDYITVVQAPGSADPPLFVCQYMAYSITTFQYEVTKSGMINHPDRYKAVEEGQAWAEADKVPFKD